MRYEVLVAAWDGGLPQNVVVEATDRDTAILRAGTTFTSLGDPYVIAVRSEEDFAAEWHAADQADVQERTALDKDKYAHPFTKGHLHDHGAHPGWRGHDGFAVHRHEMTTGRAQWELMAGDGTPITTMAEQRAADMRDAGTD